MKQIVCSAIDIAQSKWILWKNNIDREKYINFNDTFPDNAYFCNEILSNVSLNNALIMIDNRIGSQSADGEVYSITFGKLQFALKLMPRIDNDSENKNKREILTATEASKYPEYFPKTFAFGYCPESSYYTSVNGERSSFISKAIEYKNINTIYNLLSGNSKKRFLQDYRNGNNLNDLKAKYNINLLTNETIQVDFLISELANGDLGNWMSSERNISEWKQIIIDIVVGTYYLTVLVRKVHPDLHVGNVLITSSNGKTSSRKIKALIHDFGRCYDVDENIPVTYKASLLSFCSEFISCSERNDLYIPRKILIAVQDIYKIISKTNVNKHNIKEIYENILYPILNNI